MTPSVYTRGKKSVHGIRQNEEMRETNHVDARSTGIESYDILELSKPPRDPDNAYSFLSGSNGRTVDIAKDAYKLPCSGCRDVAKTYTRTCISPIRDSFARTSFVFAASPRSIVHSSYDRTTNRHRLGTMEIRGYDFDNDRRFLAKVLVVEPAYFFNIPRVV
ncbi:uncharacterized protein LOC116847886 [Odontomachus brunneus]|uniref:uncharacterized protein LOC116847886 n=1 Tax=Odontomachus brunneus TaxID=486640 RepID=UPI0013F2425C|nr:uncharacterized protein LOC116847886 [Odontomachus brunneus]